MAKGPRLVDRVTPLSLCLIGASILVLELAFGLVWTSRRTFQSGRVFRNVLLAYGAGSSGLAAQGLPDAIAAKPRRYAHPRLMDALLKLRAGDLEGAAALYQGVLDEKDTMLEPREKAVCWNGLGVIRVMKDRAKGQSEARELFQKAAEAWPALPESQVNLAVLAWMEGKADDARRFLAQAVSADCLPPGMDAARNLALLKMEMAEDQGSMEAAVAEARRLVGYRPTGVEERIVLARALARQIKAGPVPERPSWGETEAERLIAPISEHLRERDRTEVLADVSAWRMEAYWGAHQRKLELGGQDWDLARRAIWEHLNAAIALAPADAATPVRLLRCAQWARDATWRPAPLSTLEASGPAAGEFKALLDRKDLPDRVRAAAEKDLGFLLAYGGKPAGGAP